MRTLIAFLLLYGMTAHAQPIVLPKHVQMMDTAGNLMRNTNVTVHIKQVSKALYYCHATIPGNSDNAAAIMDISIIVPGEWKNKFHWLPNIKMRPDQVVAQHVFRSPCIIQTLKEKSVVLIPDVKVLAENVAVPHYLDLTYTDSSVALHYGVAHTKVSGHVYYEKTRERLQLQKPVKLAFWLIIPETADPLTVLKMTNQFLWDTIAHPYTKKQLPQVMPLAQYADTGYSMALKHYWIDVNDSIGGITLSTFLKDGVYAGRYFKNDLWYQSWFNNMRTAYGMYDWGMQLGRQEWKDRAMKVVNLLMSAPRNNGWFATVYAPEENKWLASGSPGFSRQGSYYVPDNAWTAYWLLRFSKELKEVADADELLLQFGDALLKVQNEDGSFPAGVRGQDLQADSTLNHSASSAMATWYLEGLLLAGKVPANSAKRYREVIRKSLDFLRRDILPNQRFEDFESFFSCSPKPMHYYDTSTAMHSQNTLSMQWCAEAFLQAYKLFNKKEDLRSGEYCLNILSLYQQAWNPPFISFYAFGGFGAQNTDGEWSDARQAQFAETYYRFYQVTNKSQYLERAVAACRASFALMVLPENKTIAPNNYQGTRRNGEQWSGNMAENYGHHGADERSYQSGFHWGTGSALTTAAILE